MTEPLTYVTFRHPLFRTSLQLKRVPKYMRFVVTNVGSSNRLWDALDQPDDAPGKDEMVFAAVLESRGTVHIDLTRNGRRVGEWHDSACYVPIDPQPPDDVLRDKNRWREWCMSEHKKGSE